MNRYVECVICEERFYGESFIAAYSREIEVDNGEVETRCLSCIETIIPNNKEKKNERRNTGT